ncbi:hypothetical protein BV25DRAFT_1853507 [Artomyces pyxidatus]|uniref:Uncharacterized protein n=1 Tax=Artomyces pyxidatus TaxID=48021 RepID=A0ACB8T7Q3_9AGAM|nr:hypothetical protein BV25DRAFT_1853507 [Artomyces pyxidatus]
MSYLSLVVDSNGTKLAFIDSGVPTPVRSEPYTTIFAFHGMGFSSHTFKRLHTLAPAYNLRFVSVNRRRYAASTPLSPSELDMPTNGSDVEKTAFLNARGIEAAMFIDKFIQQNDIPPISTSGLGGGIGLLGWSAGNSVTLSVVANLDVLSSETQARFASRLRALIMYEPPSMITGAPVPKGTWLPQFDPTLPTHLQQAMWTPWVSSYFAHSDLSKRDPTVLTVTAPSLTPAPTVYNMSPEEIADSVDDTVTELPALIHATSQQSVIYRKACFEREVRTRLPHMKVTHLCGDKTISSALATLWGVQDDAEVDGGNMVEFNLVPDANHFMHWDHPEKTLEACLLALEPKQE